MSDIDPHEAVFSAAEGARHLAAYEALFPSVATMVGAVLLALALGLSLPEAPATGPAATDRGAAVPVPTRAVRT